MVLRVETVGPSPMPETLVYRGPFAGVIGLSIATCKDYCKNLREAHQWINGPDSGLGIKVTPLYVSCDTDNNEDLSTVAGVGGGQNNYHCQTDDDCASASTLSSPPLSFRLALLIRTSDDH